MIALFIDWFNSTSFRPGPISWSTGWILTIWTWGSSPSLRPCSRGLRSTCTRRTSLTWTGSTCTTGPPCLMWRWVRCSCCWFTERREAYRSFCLRCEKNNMCKHFLRSCVSFFLLRDLNLKTRSSCFCWSFLFVLIHELLKFNLRLTDHFVLALYVWCHLPPSFSIGGRLRLHYFCAVHSVHAHAHFGPCCDSWRHRRRFLRDDYHLDERGLRGWHKLRWINALVFIFNFLPICKFCVCFCHVFCNPFLPHAIECAPSLDVTFILGSKFRFHVFPQSSSATWRVFFRFSLQVGYSIGTSFTSIWNVSDCNFEEGKFDGMAKLTILTSALQLSPVVLIWMFPTGKQAVFDSLKNEVSQSMNSYMFFRVWNCVCPLGIAIWITKACTAILNYIA